MRDQLEHNIVNPRQPGGWSVRDAGQLAAATARQMLPGQLDLFLDQVVVIQQPFGSGCDAPVDHHGEGGAAESARSPASFAVSRARAGDWRCVLDAYPMGSRQRPGVALELFDTSKSSASGGSPAEGRGIQFCHRNEEICMVLAYELAAVQCGPRSNT